MLIATGGDLRSSRSLSGLITLIVFELLAFKKVTESRNFWVYVKPFPTWIFGTFSQVRQNSAVSSFVAKPVGIVSVGEDYWQTAMFSP
jgi:hypothetical protein